MNGRSDRSRTSQGPLTTDELTRLLERGYADSSRRFFARTWDVDEDIESVAVIADKGFDQKIEVAEMEPVTRATFGMIAERGGRVRGENLRRDLLLSGFGESEEMIRSLIIRGWIVILPNPGEHDCNLDSILEQGTFLQRELAVISATFEHLDKFEDDDALDAQAWSEVTAEDRSATVDDLELNLLHICALIRRDPLKLNKDGTPNRRSLGRVARGISMPGTPGEVASDLDLHNAEQFDYLTFVVSVARELQLLADKEMTYRTDDDELTRFFHSNGAERDRRLLDALQRLRFWNEIDSLRLSQSAMRNVDDNHFSQRETTGQPLIGARGFVISVLRRAQFADWVALDALAELCTQLDRHYLDRTLAQLPRKPNPAEFIHAVLERTLVWAGMLQLGKSESGHRLARLSPRGARALGLDNDVPAPEPGGCLIAQPNFEVMVFLDNAPVTVLHELYRVGERRKLSDRVATFQLVAESVQRGYALGADSDSLLSLLNDNSHTPVPESVAFQLGDWERVHRRLTIHLGGTALRHPEPERFDLICGQLEHDLRESPAELIRLGARDAFVTEAAHPAVQRAADAHPSLTLDALGDPPRCLYFVDPLVLMIDPYECDVTTRIELDRIAQPLPDESSPRSLFFELDMKKIAHRFSDDPLTGIYEFLAPRCEDGLPSAQSLRLQAELASPARIHLESEVTVLTFESLDAAERFQTLLDAPDIIGRRLGPMTFSVVNDQLPLLEELIEELHLEKSSSPFDDDD